MKQPILLKQASSLSALVELAIGVIAAVHKAETLEDVLSALENLLPDLETAGL